MVLTQHPGLAFLFLAQYPGKIYLFNSTSIYVEQAGHEHFGCEVQAKVTVIFERNIHLPASSDEWQ